MDDRDIAKYAALFAAGLITHDALLETLGDDNIVNQIIAASGAGVVVGAASDLIEDSVDVAMDVVDSINPFSGW